jgi:hypothetical protein
MASSSFRYLLEHVEAWSRVQLRRPLRPYQLEAAGAILESIRLGRGDVITVMMSRQAGKNELSAQLESFLLARYQTRVESAVKAAPTFKPQIINSLLRLQTMLELGPVTAGRWKSEHGYIIRLGRCRWLFFSSAPGASIVGATASLLLEVDEAQDVLAERYDRDLSPMASSTNATRVMYGTAWDSRSLLARQELANVDSQARDGRRRHFAYPWHVVAEHNRAYGLFVEGERDRLGPEHPLFVTQYELRTIDQEAGLFTPAMLRSMRGEHLPMEIAGDGTYVAGLDVAGGSEEATDELAREVRPRQDSTVLLVGRVEWADVGPDAREAVISVVGGIWWTGHRHRDQYEDLVDLLRHTWRVSRVCVDKTGVGAPLAEFLTLAMGEDVVDSVPFSSVKKSELGYGLIAAAGSGRLKWYAHGPDDRSATEFWHEAEVCQREVRPSRLLRWSVPESSGHDDFISAAALLVAAGAGVTGPAASAITFNPDPEGVVRRRERFGSEWT